MKVFSYNRWLIAFIILGLVAALVIDVQRYNVEQDNMKVDMAIDYEGLVELAEREGLPPQEVFRQAKEAGITSLAVYETTFKKLNANGKATATAGSTLLERYHNGALVDPAWRALVQDGSIIGTEVYVTGHDKQTFREVKEDILRRLGPERVRSFSVSGEEVLAVKANYEAFLKMDLGMPTDEMKIVNAAGFYVIARPTNYQQATAEDVESVFKRLEGVKVSEMIFSGAQALGAPKALETTIRELGARDITLGLIEDTTQLQFYKQDGLMELAKGLHYKAARLYAIPKDEQPKLKLSEGVERWLNTDEERNIRVDLMRIYDKPSPNMTLLETNMKYFSDTRDALVKHGFTIGPAGTFPQFYPDRLLRMLVMIGVAAAAVLYLSLVIPGLKPRHQYILFAVLAILAAVPLLMGNGNKIRLIAALTSANLFPAIAVIWQLDRIRSISARKDSSLVRIIVTGAIALFASGVISYIGAAYLSGSLADVEYLLEVNVFRGIKLTFILPLLLVSIAFLQRFDVFDGSMDDSKGVLAQMKKILDMPVKVKTLLGLFMVLIAGIVFVARSGHTMGMPVSSLELHFRGFLEQAMYARPRTKELLIGHPAFMLAAMAWYRKWPTMILFVLVIVAAIGQGSMVETFAHMRTPIYMSFMRGIGGIVLGACLGVLAMMAVHLWQCLISSAKGRKAENE
jgi:hypothetical protein